jgi:hypothetical protein
MNSIETWTAFFGWCTVVNVVIYLLTVTALMLARGFATRVNCAVFGVTEEDARRAAFQYVARFKLAVTVFFFAPWLALKLMA